MEGQCSPQNSGFHVASMQFYSSHQNQYVQARNSIIQYMSNLLGWCRISIAYFVGLCICQGVLAKLSTISLVHPLTLLKLERSSGVGFKEGSFTSERNIFRLGMDDLGLS